MEFTAFARKQEGRGNCRRMRRAGKAPGIVYGGKDAPTAIELDHNALVHALRTEAFHSSILSMKLDGSATKVLLRDVQMHPFRNEVLHVDFQRVDEHRRIHMKVPLHFVNEQVSPAVKEQGAIVSHVMTELDIACLPKDLPEFIEVDLSSLDTSTSLHVSGIKLPQGVAAVTHGKLDPVVATAVVPKAVVETEEETAAAATEGAAAAGAAAPATAAPAAEAKPEKGAEKKESGKDDKKK
ncbi:MAG TPA: 50S ribosomal protein L25/general stress protein Ctc [Casimicrobiaceae bacterium]|nr:50S ribosomal protein L25/general stress protein Ctc [Casimicrobiaceae bacterium]